jgi:hypothetical protein
MLNNHEYYEASLSAPVEQQKRLMIVNKDEHLLNNEMYLWNEVATNKAQISAVKCGEYLLP